jgi:hypothetical protein
MVAGVDDDLRPSVGGVAAVVTYPAEAIPAGGLHSGFVLVGGRRSVPAYRPIMILSTGG